MHTQGLGIAEFWFTMKQGENKKESKKRLAYMGTENLTEKLLSDEQSGKIQSNLSLWKPL